MPAVLAENAVFPIGDFNVENNDIIASNTHIDNHTPVFSANDKVMVRLSNTFEMQFRDYEMYYNDLDRLLFKESMITSSLTLLTLNPDSLSLELTAESSILYTIKCGEYTFFLQHFFDTECIDDEEALLSVYKKKIKMPSYAGPLEDLVKTIARIKNS